MLNVGVIGLGHWGPNVLRNFTQNPRTRVRAVCDLSPAAFDRVERFLSPECARETDPTALIEDPAIEALALVTPPRSHFPLAKAALQAGKHVLCEKPLTLTVSEGEELCALASSSDLKLMVGFTFLYNSAVQAMRNMVDEGRLGRLYYMTANRTHLGLVREDVSVLWDLAPHDVSIMNAILGEMPERVSAVGASPLGADRADVAFIHLFYPGGVVGHIEVSWIDSNKRRVVRVVGDRARAEFNDLNNLEPVRLFEKGMQRISNNSADFGKHKLLLRDGDIISPRIELNEPLESMTSAFVGHVLDGDPCISDGAFGVGVTRVLVAAQESLRAMGEPVDVSPVGAARS